MPVLLHGLFDALLTLQQPFLALGCGVVSASYLAYLIVGEAQREAAASDSALAPAAA
ncbi:MAG: hypothetical protein AB7N76_01315 [Planctomycetota bacterium]